MKKIIFPAALAIAMQVAPSYAEEFDFEKAAAIEGTFRGIVTHCAEPVFAKEFIEGSKAQVAYSLQGENTVVPIPFVEGLIQDYANRAELTVLTNAQCDDFVKRFKLLHESRKTTLSTTKELTATVIESAEQGTLTLPGMP